MNAIHPGAATVTPSTKRICQSCDGEGVHYTSRYGGNDPDTYVDHVCQDCDGDGWMSPEMAMVHDARDDLLSAIAKLQAAYRLVMTAPARADLTNAIENIDTVIKEDLDDGVIQNLTRERNL